MKKIKYLIAFIFMFVLTLNVNAETKLSAHLECNDTAKIGESVVCNIKADIDEGSITSLNATLYIELPNGENYNYVFTEFNDNLKEMGSNITIGKIEVSKDKIVKSGNLSISLQFNSYIALTGEVSFTPDIINKQVKILNNNANLDSLNVDGTNLINSLDKEYTYNKETVEINAILSDNNASIKSGTGKINLKCGTNTYNIVTLAEDKTSSKTYKLLINRTCDENATLKDIKLSSGSLNPVFNSSTVNYTINVSKDIDKLTITPVLTSEKSKYTINNSDKNEISLDYGNNDIKIEVESETGSKNTYTLSINREDGRDNNNYLSDIKLSDGKILFDKEILEYNVKVLYEVSKIDIEATPEMSTSKVEITNVNELNVGTNVITIKVVSEKGEEKVYTLNVERLKEGEELGDNPKIKDIVISGYDFDFNSDVTSYTLKISNEDKLDITVYMEDDTASYVIKDNKDLKNKSVITINTLSLDGSTLTYKIFIEKSNSLLLIIVIVLIVIITIGLLVFIVIKNKNKNKVKNTVIKEDKILSKIDKQLGEINDYAKEPLVKEVSTPKEEEYKICPLCGHKISFEASICPYCKKNFSKSTEIL